MNFLNSLLPNRDVSEDVYLPDREPNEVLLQAMFTL